MANVKFYLNTPKKVNSSISFRINYGAFEIVNGKKRYFPLQYHLDEVINTAYWNSNKGATNKSSKKPLLKIVSIIISFKFIVSMPVSN